MGVFALACRVIQWALRESSLSSKLDDKDALIGWCYEGGKMKHSIGRNTVLGLSLIALSAAVFQVANSWLMPGKAEAQTGSQRSAFFTASQVFGLAQKQRARFCVGTVNSQGPELDWTVRISDE